MEDVGLGVSAKTSASECTYVCMYVSLRFLPGRLVKIIICNMIVKKLLPAKKVYQIKQFI